MVDQVTAVQAAPEWDVERSRHKGCKRWSTYPRNVVDLSVAEMDVSLCAPVLDAVREAVHAEAFGYPVPDARSDVPAATARWLRGFGLHTRPEDIRIVPDVLRGIAVAIRTFTPPGSTVLVPTPSYPRFLEVVPLTGRECVQVPMLANADGYELDLDRIEHGLAAGAGSVLLANPINPLGVIIEPSQLTELAKMVDRWQARVIVDEVHAPVRYGRPFVPYAALNATSRGHAVTVTSATKAWNFPGLRTAMVVLTGPDDQTAWNELPHLETSGCSPLGMVATTAALKHGQAWLRAVLDDLDNARRVVAEHLAGAGLPGIWRMPDATYFAWLDLREWEPERPAAFLLDTAEVAVGEGAHYGTAGTGFVRLNFATPHEVLSEALDRIVGALRQQGRRRTG